MRDKISKIVNIYVVLLIIVFPVFMRHQYYDIQNDKLCCVIFLTFLTAGCIALLFLLKGLKVLFRTGGPGKKKRKKRRKISHFQIEEAGAQPRKSLRDRIYGLKRTPGLSVTFMLIFFAVLIISTLGSEWRYEAFWGNMGREQGFYIWSVYILGFCLIALFYRPKRLHIELFIFMGFVIAFWGVLDYFYLSPIGWQETIPDYARLDFSSGIGNVNLLTAVEGVYLLVTAVMFVTEKTLWKAALYYISAVVIFVALIVGYSDNAIISLGTLFAFLPLYCFRDRKGVLRYFLLLFGEGFAIFFVSLIAVKPGVIGDRRSERIGTLYDFARIHEKAALVIFIAAGLVLAAVYTALRISKKKDRKEENGDYVSENLRKGWAVLLIAAMMGGIALLVDANTSPDPAKYGSLSSILVFDDDWGTFRGMNWRLALGYMADFSPWKFLFGTGLETYSIYTITFDYYNMVRALNVIFDSPHNEWLQMLFTTGILGFGSFYGTVLVTVLGGFKARKEGFRDIATALCYGVICYALVSFVNVSTANTMVYLILLLGMLAAIVRMNDETSN